MDVEMQSLVATLEGITRRMDDAQVLSTQRHRENVERFSEVRHDLQDVRDDVKAVEKQARLTNGRVNTLEAMVEWLKTRARVTRARENDEDSDSESPTLGDIKWYLMCVGAGFGAAMGLLKLMGKL